VSQGTLKTQPSHLKVLVVEDNADAAEMLKCLLEVHGCRVWSAGDATTALHLTRACRPDVALCDIGLSGSSGYDLARAIREDRDLRHTKLVALTGYGHAEDRQRCLESGFDLHVIKPVDAPSLLAVLRRLAD
jgi:CheY-like chemotaxis protein